MLRKSIIFIIFTSSSEYSTLSLINSACFSRPLFPNFFDQLFEFDPSNVIFSPQLLLNVFLEHHPVLLTHNEALEGEIIEQNPQSIG